MASIKTQKKIVRRKKEMPCPFCKENTIPDYKNYKDLEKFVSERGKIISSLYTGVCAKHQRRLALSIKRARFLGLLPYTPMV